MQYKTGIVIENRNNRAEIILEERGFPPKLAYFKPDQYLMKDHQHRLDILRNRHFIVHSFALKLHVVRDTNGEPIGGMGYKFVKTFIEYYNSTFDFSHEGAKNNRQMRNGSWNGFIGALADSRADIAIWFGNTETRHPYVDITTPAINLPLVFFTPLPRASVKCNSSVLFQIFGRKKYWHEDVFSIYFTQLEHVPETPEELWKMQQYQIRYLSFPGAACDLFFSHAKSSMYLDIKNKMKYFPLSSTIQSMMETALVPKTAQL
ncbi:unnamed protein product [Allacma fusca]|uniref:Ionotropic glutamate receptor L-glutamate and glycine-binding domain-containing protein n=1 Tax=Allacma fusca TaxID=39272 RepID=A0A8J2P2B4_9HEXA|nr:unnamed protein product [Allacma fusca]